MASLRHLLMVAFHFPPCRGSSGLQRSLAFSRCLLSHRWTPVVISAHPAAYPEKGDDQLHDIPPGVRVYRPLALDTARHIAIRGRYFSWMALPDRWMSWAVFAIPVGLYLEVQAACHLVNIPCLDRSSNRFLSSSGDRIAVGGRSKGSNDGGESTYRATSPSRCRDVENSQVD
jgi:hypothetical protein